MNKGKLRLMFIAVLIFSVVLAGCGVAPTTTFDAKKTDQPVEGGDFRFGMIADATSIDPAFAQDNNGIEVMKELFDSLVKYKDEDLSIQPGLAEKWEVSSDGLVYTFHLRKDVKFHDGSPMKADDVIASWTRGLLKETAASVTYVLDPIKGAKDVMQGKTNTVEGLKKLDDYTLQVTLEKPNAAFLTSLGHPNAGVYKVEAARKGGKDFGTPGSKPEWVIGTGPFKFVEWKADQQIVLAKNADYWGAKAHVDKVIYRIFKEEGTALNEFRAGNLEYVDLLPPGQRQSLLKEFPDLIDRTTALATFFLGYNMEKEPFKSNLKLREALSYAVDRQAIIDTVYEGVSTPAKGPIPPGMPGFNKDVKAPAYDKEKAKQLLSEAGFPDGKGLPTLEIKYNFSQLNQKIVEAVQGMFKDIGVNSTIVNQEWGAYIRSLQASDSQIFRLAWSADYPDPDNFLYALYHSSQKGDNNDSFYGNPEVDRLLSEGRLETDSAKRMKLYQEAEQIIIQDAPAIWLFNVQYLHLHAKNVHNLYPTALEQKHMARVWLSK